MKLSWLFVSLVVTLDKQNFLKKMQDKFKVVFVRQELEAAKM